MKKIDVPKIRVDVNEDNFENYYIKEELEEFLAHVKNDYSMKWYVIFRTLAFSGLRKGEFLALQWQDIDYKGKTIGVNKTVAYGLNNKLIIQSPKTKESNRLISVDDNTLNVLRQWREQQADDMLKLGFNTRKPNQLVVSTLKNDYIHLSNTTNKIDRIIKRYNLKIITTHGLRHTHAILLFESGAKY